MPATPGFAFAAIGVNHGHIFEQTREMLRAGCRLKSNKATSRAHITNIHQKVHYSTNPPTSGRHYYVPASAFPVASAYVPRCSLSSP